MATEHIRDKINQMRNLILQEDLQVFQHECLMDAAAETTGDKQIDASMKATAQNARAVVIGSKRRMAVYRKRLAGLEAELKLLEEQEQQDPPAGGIA